MKKLTPIQLLALLLTSTALLFAGCSDDAGDDLEDAADDVSDAAEKVGEGAAEAAEEAADEIEDATN